MLPCLTGILAGLIHTHHLFSGMEMSAEARDSKFFLQGTGQGRWARDMCEVASWGDLGGASLAPGPPEAQAGAHQKVSLSRPSSVK